MEQERHCTKCGGRLPADAPQGLCPQCLMELGLPSGLETENGSDSRGAKPDESYTGPHFTPPTIQDLAARFPQLEIIELLGQGGMGAVYKARQKQLDRLVALKILPPQVGRTPTPTETEKVLSGEAFTERFTREARSLARLNHPHIVMVYDFGRTEDGLYYFIMEFVDGTDLRRVIQTGRLSPVEALAIVPQVCEALQYAHEEGIVHRDIKPENILIDKKGKVKIADFGLAKILDRPATAYTLTQAGQRMGTPHYMAPEQIEHPGQVDHRADIYSLGVVFYEMLTGELPLGRFPLPSRKVHVDVRLDEVVLKTLEKEPKLRYQHASEVKTDVENISYSGTPKTGPARKAFQRYKADSRTEEARHRVWIPSIGLMIAGALDCLAVAGSFFATFVSTINTGLSGHVFPFIFIPGLFRFFIVVLVAAHAVLVVWGAWNLMQLRSHRMAWWGSVLAMIPSAGFLIGLPMGIWALILLNKDEVEAAFGQEETEVSIPPQVRQFAVSAVGQVKETFEREKAEFAKLRSSKRSQPEPSGAADGESNLGLPIASCILGLLGIIAAGMDTVFAFTFLFIFFSIFLAILTFKKTDKSHRAQRRLAAVGIFLGIVATITLLSMW